ncbi:hypothetical protein STRDD11_02517 [Streptococcus sp. DD11]|nr:hypothetical protein STRDD11_02517 [Streptococcus sp. DD11]
MNSLIGQGRLLIQLLQDIFFSLSKDLTDSPCADIALIERIDQHGQLEQLHQDLQQVIDQGHQPALGQQPLSNSRIALPDDRQQGGIDHQKSQRTDETGQKSGPNLPGFVEFIFISKIMYFPSSLPESTNNPHALQLLPGQTDQLICQLTDFGIERIHQPGHDIDNQGQHPHHGQKPNCNSRTDCQGHDDRAKDNDGGPQKEAEKLIDPRLDLVGVAG